MWEKLIQLTSIEDKRMALRAEIELGYKPCIPFLGIYLNDLEHLGAAEKIEKEKIIKFRKLSKENSTSTVLMCSSGASAVSNNSTCSGSGITPLSTPPTSPEIVNRYKNCLLHKPPRGMMNLKLKDIQAYGNIQKQPDDASIRAIKTLKSTKQIYKLISNLQNSNYNHLTNNLVVQEFIESFTYAKLDRKTIEEEMYQFSLIIEPMEGHGQSQNFKTMVKKQSQKNSPNVKRSKSLHNISFSRKKNSL